MPRHGQNINLETPRIMTQFRSQVNLAPRRRFVVYVGEFYLRIILLKCALISLHMRTSRAGAEYGASASNDTPAALQNPKVRGLAGGQDPTNTPSLTEDLGTYSPRKERLRGPISAHETHASCSSVWVRPSNICREEMPPTSLRRHPGTIPQEDLLASQKSSTEGKPREAKSCTHALRAFSPLAHVCPSSDFGFPYASWTTCTSKGGT